MTAVKDYSFDFIKRTKEIVQEDFHNFKIKGREVTFLLNCLLGLVITGLENKKNQNGKEGIVPKNLLDLVPDKLGFIPRGPAKLTISDNLVTEIRCPVKHKADLQEGGSMWFIKKLRNCIAHQHVEPINKDEHWTGVRLWNINSGFKDFEIIFSIEELKRGVNCNCRYIHKRQGFVKIRLHHFPS